MCKTTRSPAGSHFDRAADDYIKMAGDTTAMPTGAVEELMEHAVEQGSVTPEEIAKVLGTEELPVETETSYSVGEK